VEKYEIWVVLVVIRVYHFLSNDQLDTISVDRVYFVYSFGLSHSIAMFLRRKKMLLFILPWPNLMDITHARKFGTLFSTT
jgi:hypothetical protein